MRYARLFADNSGESHFDDIEIEFTATDYVQSAAPLDLSATFAASQVAFMRAPARWASEFHVSSARNMFVVLSGKWEVTASDGESRHFAAGSALLVEDTTGRGHSSRVIGETAALAAMVELLAGDRPTRQILT
jgi:quercetin dioxygenase-like cupin family protein